MKIDFISDINKDYTAALNYERVDRFIVTILWWHFVILALLTFTNSVLQAARYYPSPFSWRLIGWPEAISALLLGFAASLLPTWVRGKLDHHYLWRVFVSVALTTYSYLFVLISGGSIEMHFHFFMIMGLLVIYADWRLGWIVLVLTALHHSLLNYVQPEWVYFYGRNDISVIAHGLPVLIMAVFTTLLCQNHRQTIKRQQQLTESLMVSNENLEQTRDQALTASRLKTELLAKVSHELRTPLGVILGYAEMMQRGVFGPLSGEQHASVNRIIEGSDYLTKQVNELLDQARLEAGQLKLNTSVFVLADMVNQVQVQMQALAQAKGLNLKTEIAADLPQRLSGDPVRLQQILANLVGNAIKFTKNGSVCVSIYKLYTSQWAMQVSDTGPGIPVEAQSLIFEPFRQVDGSDTRQHSGAGLGLSIVKQLVALMGGQVTLESQVGQGSTFTVMLPLENVKRNA
jgi:signal transduction histidine kinase